MASDACSCNERMIDQFKSAPLYVITCPPKEGPCGYEAMVRAACEGGADILQFRDKLITGRERYTGGREAAEDLSRVQRAFYRQ